MSQYFKNFMDELRNRGMGAPAQLDLGDTALKGAANLVVPQGSLASPYTEADYQQLMAKSAPLDIPVTVGRQPEEAPSVEKLMEALTAGGDVSTPASILQPPMADAVPPASSRAKISTSKDKAVTKDSASAIAAPALKSDPSAPKEKTAEDTLMQQLLGQKGEAQGKEKALRDSAESDKNLTDDEKIAYALLGALPGLVGAIGGGAIAGGWGAAAGAAGGLQGGASGMQAIAQGKQDARKEKLGQADKLQTKVDHIDMQIAANDERLATQDFSAGQAQKVRDENARLEKQKEEFHAGEGAKDRGARRGDIMMQGKIQQGIHSQDNAAELDKAGIAAAAKAGGKGEAAKDYELNAARYATRMISALPDIQKGMADRATAGGAFLAKADWLNAMKNPQQQRYATAVGNFISGVLRKDSGAAITPEEWETAYKTYFPIAGDSHETIAQKAAIQKREAVTMYGSAGNAQHIVQDALKVTEEPAAGGATSGSVTLKSKYGF